MTAWLDALGAGAAGPPLAATSVADLLAASASSEPPVVAALLSGARVERLGHAFAAGYREAVRALVADLDPPLPAALRALAATEAGGAHPRALATTLVADRLDGEKTFVTLGDVATRALVVARVGERDGRPELAVVDVALDAPGVVRTPGPALPFCPEVAHAVVRFEGVIVPASARLPGDGYARWLKPFRTVEDLHVHAALVGHLARLALHAADAAPGASLHERALALAAGVVGLADAPPESPVLHLALAGLLDATARLFDDVRERLPSGEARDRLTRDAPLLRVAGKARAARLEAARRAVAGAP